MASSGEEPHQLPPNHHQAATAAPPPTPSIQYSTDLSSTTDIAHLSTLLHRLPPSLSLSLPTRRSSKSPPVLSLTDPLPTTQKTLLSAAAELGFFHLRPHHQQPISSAVETAALSLFNLTCNQKNALFPNSSWPLGFNDQDDDHGECFCIDSSSSCDFKGLDYLQGFCREMEGLGLRLIRELSTALGFQNPIPDELCSVLWVSSDDNGRKKPGRVYPYVIGLHYIPNCRKYSVCSDSGWVNVSGQKDFVLVTLGDIAQVWSNGKCKKVRGRPMTCEEDDPYMARRIALSVLITLPMESMVIPRIPNVVVVDGADPEEDHRINNENPTFQSFPFEDYAWRIYHESFLHKDSLFRYRI